MDGGGGGRGNMNPVCTGRKIMKKEIGKRDKLKKKRIGREELENGGGILVE